jgi:hypothetical protein
VTITLEDIVEEIEAAGLAYDIKNGSKHIKIVVCGEFCGIWPRIERGDLRATKNIRAQVRRCIKKHTDAVDVTHRTM